MNQEIAECEGQFRDIRDFILSFKFVVHLVTIKCPYFSVMNTNKKSIRMMKSSKSENIS